MVLLFQTGCLRIGGRYLGFLIQARKVGTTEAVGSFSNHPTGTKRLNCSNGDSASHSDRTEKSDIELTWTPPSEKGEGPVQFVATVVLGQQLFWMNVTSDVIPEQVETTTSKYTTPGSITTMVTATGQQNQSTTAKYTTPASVTTMVTNTAKQNQTVFTTVAYTTLVTTAEQTTMLPEDCNNRCSIFARCEFSTCVCKRGLDGDGDTCTSVSDSTRYDYTLTMDNITFTNDLMNRSSPAAMALAEMLEERLEFYFKRSSIAEAYHSVTVTGFREGSVIANYSVNVNTTANLQQDEVEDALYDAIRQNMSANFLNIVIPQLTTPAPTTVSTTEPPTTVSTTEPPTTVYTTEPPTTFSTTKPPTTVSTTEPPTTFSTTEPPTTVSTTEPPTTVSTTEPPTTVIDTITQTGDTITHTGDTITQIGDAITQTGDTITQTGDTITLTGDTITKTGDTITQTGDTITLTGDTITQTGYTITQTGDTITQTGDTITQTGDTITQTGDTITQTGHAHADHSSSPHHRCPHGRPRMPGRLSRILHMHLQLNLQPEHLCLRWWLPVERSSVRAERRCKRRAYPGDNVAGSIQRRSQRQELQRTQKTRSTNSEVDKDISKRHRYSGRRYPGTLRV
ncbi:cell wall protein DAN4-like [Branchiostoma floridae]|uniref:Cell wall protein DAN4-like n=1 Tax=Branchiostoma floridae TaxID=7739 RepID=A0A9J7MXT4_BRAFL|nr:cell wall protein DAN4-like [Branchiostoma floridae]